MMDLNSLKKALKDLTDDERMEIFSDYCLHCGRHDVNENNSPFFRSCQCWNDE